MVLWLERLARGMALLGAAVILAGGMVLVCGVVGRELLDAPIIGDFEIVQLAAAIGVASFLPYTQLRRANVIVDFFTRNSGPSAQRRMEQAGSILLGVMMLLVTWRSAVAAADVWASGERTMLLGLPAWISYVGVLPGLLLSGLAAFVPAPDVAGDARK